MRWTMPVTILAALACGGCVVGGPLFGLTEDNPVSEIERAPKEERVTHRVDAVWDRSNPDAAVVALEVTREVETVWRERERTGVERVYHFGEYSLKSDLLTENTIAHAYAPVLFMIDLFRVPYYLIRGEWQVAGMAAAGIFYVMPGIQMAIKDRYGSTPLLTEEGGIVRYPPSRWKAGEWLERREVEAAPAARAEVAVEVGGAVLARVPTDAEGRATLHVGDWDALVAALTEAGGRELVFRTGAEGAAAPQTALVVADRQRNALRRSKALRDREGQ